jgi:hypothetical protein
MSMSVLQMTPGHQVRQAGCTFPSRVSPGHHKAGGILETTDHLGLPAGSSQAKYGKVESHRLCMQVDL